MIKSQKKEAISFLFDYQQEDFIKGRNREDNEVEDERKMQPNF